MKQRRNGSTDSYLASFPPDTGQWQAREGCRYSATRRARVCAHYNSMPGHVIILVLVEALLPSKGILWPCDACGMRTPTNHQRIREPTTMKIEAPSETSMQCTSDTQSSIVAALSFALVPARAVGVGSWADLRSRMRLRLSTPLSNPFAHLAAACLSSHVLGLSRHHAITSGLFRLPKPVGERPLKTGLVLSSSIRLGSPWAL